MRLALYLLRETLRSWTFWRVGFLLFVLVVSLLNRKRHAYLMLGTSAPGQQTVLDRLLALLQTCSYRPR